MGMYVYLQGKAPPWQISLWKPWTEEEEPWKQEGEESRERRPKTVQDHAR